MVSTPVHELPSGNNKANLRLPSTVTQSMQLRSNPTSSTTITQKDRPSSQKRKLEDDEGQSSRNDQSLVIDCKDLSILY